MLLSSSIIFLLALAPFSETTEEENDATLAPVENYRNYSMHFIKPPADADFDFNPDRLENRLISLAMASFTPPDVYFNDLRTYFKGAGGYVNEMDRLKRTYDIESKPKNSDSITEARLKILFPHIFCDSNHVISSKRTEKGCPFVHLIIPPIMRHPQFGGLIPRQCLNNDGIRLALVHLVWQFCDSENAETSEDLGDKLLKRIKFSRLSDESRVRILQESGILTPEGNLEDKYFVEARYLPEILVDRMADWAKQLKSKNGTY